MVAVAPVKMAPAGTGFVRGEAVLLLSSHMMLVAAGRFNGAAVAGRLITRAGRRTGSKPSFLPAIDIPKVIIAARCAKFMPLPSILTKALALISSTRNLVSPGKYAWCNSSNKLTIA